MGDASDTDDLFGKALHEKRTRLLWSMLTAIGTAIATTFTVGWTMRGHVDRIESELAQQGRDISDLKEALKVIPTMQRELQEARAQADKAMLYAQLTKKDKP